MSENDQLKFDYGQSNWRQSIAVRIASQIIWILVPTAFVSSLFIFSEIDKYILQNFEYKVESLTYRVTNLLLSGNSLSNVDKDLIIEKIGKQLEFDGVKVISSNYKYEPSIDTKQLESTTRTVQLTLGEHFDNEFISVTSFHEPISSVISRTQKKILGVIIVLLTILASLLVYTIRQKIYRPLNMLVSATRGLDVTELWMLLS